jgi:hypothetical protein
MSGGYHPDSRSIPGRDTIRAGGTKVDNSLVGCPIMNLITGREATVIG